MTRRVREYYMQKMEKLVASRNEAKNTKPLMITLKRHEFPDNHMLTTTIFGTIANCASSHVAPDGGG